MLYEVLLPSVDVNGYDETITVDAPNWMVALKSGLERTGEPNADIRNVMCDIKDDNSIHVTDVITRRVFVLREVEPEVDEEADLLRRQAAEAAERQAVERLAAQNAAKEAAQSPPATVRTDAVTKPAPTPEPAHPIAQPKPEPAPEPARPVAQPKPEPVAQKEGYTQTPSGSWVSPDGSYRVGSATYESLQRDSEAPVVVKSERTKTSERPAVQYGRGESESVSENILEDIFLEIQVIHEGKMAMEEAVNFIMEMAMEKVPAESGAILFADVNGRELYFATARGPKADEVMDFRVPMGMGIAGFAAREGVSLAISDAQRDPRFYRAISDALTYPTHSLVCAPIQHEGRVYGCLELINRNNGSTFSSNEVNALTYIGKQFAEFINRLIMEREKL